MKIKTVFSTIIALAAAAMPAAAADIITETPAGQAVEYYADLQNYDNTFGFMGDYHTTQTIVFAEDGSVYIPNMLMRRTMPAYVKGTFDSEAKTITVQPGQWVFYFPNVEIPVALFTLDDAGYAGPAESEFYKNPLIFDVSDDGVISLRASDDFPMFGLCNTLNSTEVYANAKDLRFIPVKNVAGNLTHFTSTYTRDGAVSTTTASGYREGDDIIWVRGLVPSYPESWVKIERTGNDFMIKSFQVMMYFSTEDPIVAAALDKDNNAVFQMIVEVDNETLEMNIGNSILPLCNITPDNNGSFELYQKYDNIHLLAGGFAASKPAAPTFRSYSGPNSSGETEFIFDAYPVDTEGNIIVSSQLYLRMYIDGKPYTFTTAEYGRLDEDMALVPYNFNNYNYFSIGGDDNQRRYVYLQRLPADTRTIGVETVYMLDGSEQTSDRLVYDITTGKADTMLGIEYVTPDDNAPAVYYDMQGVRVHNPRTGHLYIRVAGDKASKVIMK
ncbi:MAG: hypothetical protein K2L77_05140 [Muribaculaceae bacterium]|nr:hypothetical protein [Muribaculaceae bacterium]